MKTAIFAAVIAVSASVPAFAEERAPFTGPHAELIAGYDAVDTNTAIGTPDGILYGFNLGYDMQVGGALIGAEAEVVDSDAHRFGLKTDRDLYVGARVGFAIGDRALAYAKAGYTNARFEATGAGGANADGVRVGAGLEYKLGGKVFVKGEYRYSNYEAGLERQQVVGGVGIRF